MKKIATLFLLSINIIAFSQTKLETQNWIKEKIETLTYKNYAANFGHENNVSFKGTDMILSSSYISDYDNPNPIVFNYVIPIKEMNTIIFVDYESTTWMIISIKENKKSIISTNVNAGKTENVNKVELILYKSVNDSDMKNRFIKAFNHLIKVNGGNVVDEKF